MSYTGREYLEFDSTKGMDLRCSICRQHQFLVKDTIYEWCYIHSYIDQILGNMNMLQMIHNFGLDKGYPPICLRSYKEITF